MTDTAIYFGILGIFTGAAASSAYWLAKWREMLGVKVTDYGDDWSDLVRRCLELNLENAELKAALKAKDAEL